MQFERSREAKRVLEASTDAKGRKLEVIKLPLPDPLHKTAEEAGEVGVCAVPLNAISVGHLQGDASSCCGVLLKVR